MPACVTSSIQLEYATRTEGYIVKINKLCSLLQYFFTISSWTCKRAMCLCINRGREVIPLQSYMEKEKKDKRWPMALYINTKKCGDHRVPSPLAPPWCTMQVLSDLLEDQTNMTGGGLLSLKAVVLVFW